MNNIQIKKEFNAPVEQVFDLLSKHSTYNVAVSYTHLTLPTN